MRTLLNYFENKSRNFLFLALTAIWEERFGNMGIWLL